jgi:hypothetical protein
MRAGAEQLAAGVSPERWIGCSAGDGAKGRRLYDWIRVELAAPMAAGMARWLLVRRSRSDGELAFYACFGLAATPLVGLVWVAGARWAVEQGFEQAKGEVGLDHITATPAEVAAILARWRGQERVDPAARLLQPAALAGDPEHPPVRLLAVRARRDHPRAGPVGAGAAVPLDRDVGGSRTAARRQSGHPGGSLERSNAAALDVPRNATGQRRSSSSAIPAPSEVGVGGRLGRLVTRVVCRCLCRCRWRRGAGGRRRACGSRGPTVRRGGGARAVRPAGS